MNEPIENTLKLINTNPIVLNELKLSIIQYANIKILAEINGVNCSTECNITNNYQSNDTFNVKLHFISELPLSGQLAVLFSSGFLSRNVILKFYIIERLPKLIISPNSLRFTITKGEFKNFELTLINEGDADAFNLNLTMPLITNGYLTLTDLQINNSIVSNQYNFDLPLNMICKICLKIFIDEQATLGEGVIYLEIFHERVPIYFQINYVVVSSKIVDLTVKVEDEYTYFASGKPLLADARIVLRDVKVGFQEILRTNASGMITFYNITEGYYDLSISAEKHNSVNKVWLTSSQHDEIVVFLERNSVQVLWSIKKTTYEDEYSIALTNEFETYVPMPVVVMEPRYVDLEQLESGLVNEIIFTITNYGLIRANNFHFDLPSTHPFLEFILPDDFKNFNVEANATVIVKINVIYKTTSAVGIKKRVAFVFNSCVYINITFSYKCFEEINKTEIIIVGPCITFTTVEIAPGFNFVSTSSPSVRVNYCNSLICSAGFFSPSTSILTSIDYCNCEQVLHGIQGCVNSFQTLYGIGTQRGSFFKKYIKDCIKPKKFSILSLFSKSTLCYTLYAVGRSGNIAVPICLGAVQLYECGNDLLDVVTGNTITDCAGTIPHGIE